MRMKIIFPTFFVLASCSNPQLQKEVVALKAENDSLRAAITLLKTPAEKEKATFVQLVKFKSTLPDTEVVRIINERKLQFLKVPGLVQKYYMKEKLTGEYSGIYLWKSEQDFLNYRQTELGKTTGTAYKTEGKPRVELFEMLFPLREL